MSKTENRQNRLQKPSVFGFIDFGEKPRFSIFGLNRMETLDRDKEI
jgi:hypothetical protein